MSVEELEKMTPKMREKYRELARKLPPEKRLRRSFELTSFVLETMASGIRKNNPELSDEDVRWEIIRRRLPVDLRIKAYGR